MRVSSSIRARAGSLPTSGGQAGPLPGGASDLGIPQNLGELRFPRLLSKRKSPHTYSHSGSPRVILKELAATWARHTSRRTLLHLESPLYGRGFVSWVTDNHAWQLHLSRGQKAQAGFTCVPGLSLGNIDALASCRGKACICYPTVLIPYIRLDTYLSIECRKLGSSTCGYSSD